MDSRLNLFELGKVNKVIGLIGELEVFLDSDHPEFYTNLESILIEINHELVPFFIESIRISGPFAKVKFEGVSNFDEAHLLVGAKTFLPLEKLPPLKGNRYYFHDLIGKNVIDTNHGFIGVINAISDQTQQPVAEAIFNGKEILFPLIEKFIEKIDRENNTLYVSLPEGLIGIYLEN